MQTITVKVKNENVDFFIKLLKKLNFIIEIQIANTTIKPVSRNLTSKIRLPRGKPAISDFAGLWSGNPKTLEQIRKNAWKRI